MALRQWVFLVRFPDIVEHVAAATRIEIAAVIAGASYTEGIGGWRRSVYDVVGQTGV